MPQIELGRSVIVNQGIRALPELAGRRADDPELVNTFQTAVLGSEVHLTDGALRSAIGAAATPLALGTALIDAKQAEAEGSGLGLGPALGAVSVAASGGFSRAFQGGEIFWHPLTGAHVISGPIAVRWRQLGGVSGFLGYPTTDVMAGRDPGSEGQFAHFHGGAIYYKPLPVQLQVHPAVAPAPNGAAATHVGGGALSVTLPTAAGAGAFEVHGAILEKYLALGAEASMLGYPRTDETGTPDRVGRFNHFEGGSIYWAPTCGAHEVHGLIRSRWASLGWERNPQLGYPISDELIPDRRIGHRRPETRKKPLPGVPADVIKLPADAAGAGFPAAAINLPEAAAGVSRPAAPVSSIAPSASRPAVAGAIGALSRDDSSAIHVPIVAGGIPIDRSASTPAPDASVNRFGDFQNGVLFWFRGQTAAISLSPTAKTNDGTDVSLTGAEVAAAVLAKMGRAPFQSGTVTLASLTFLGVTDYSHDGVQAHNRRHKLQLNVTAKLHGLLGITVIATAAVELQVEVLFEPDARKVVFAPVGWSLIHSSAPELTGMVLAQLHGHLDPLLWTSYELIQLPDTDGGAPIAVLSVKTLSNGTVAVFVEPAAVPLHHLEAESLLATPLSPAVIPLTPAA